MKVTIVRDDDAVGIDGAFRKVDLSLLDTSIRAVQWDGAQGHVEHYMSVNTPIDSMNEFSEVVASWTALTPPEPLPITLEEVKANRKMFINSHRDIEESSGFIYLGKTMDSNERSALRITMAVLTAQLAVAASEPFSIDWTCEDNSILTLSELQIIEMPKYLAIHSLTLHGKSKALKTAIDEATTIEQVQAISW